MAKRRVPGWLKVTLGVFGVLFVLGAIFGRPSPPATVALNGSSAPTPTTTSPPTTTYTVTSVDGTAVELTDATGNRTNVRAAGIEMPLDANCYGPETANWTSTFLTGKQITMKTLDTTTGTLAMITLADGTSYSTIALQSGHAKYAGDALSDTYAAALEAAETEARSANAGLWGPPCNGAVDALTPIPTTTTEPPTVAQEAAAPNTTTQPVHVPAQPSTRAATVSYANCGEVRAARAAPLYAGQPGYSRKLDRDGDGVACEK